MDTIRPLPVFLGISGPSFCFAPDAFTPPSKKFDKNTAEKISQRVSLNFNYFISNYAMIFVGTCVIVVLMHPGMIIYSTLVYALWNVHNSMIDNNTKFVVLEKNLGEYITVESRTRILYLITGWVIASKCFKPFLTVLVLTSLLVFSHAFMRDPKHIDSHRFYTDDAISSDDVDSCESAVVVDKTDAMRTSFNSYNVHLKPSDFEMMNNEHA